MSEQPATSSAATQHRLGGRYVLREEVGRGGMAVVHRAHDTVLDREVAAKLLHPHLATDPSFLARFRREARAAAALTHPNIVAVHDWGEHEEGAFLILQLVEGVSLRDILRVRGRLTPDETLAVLVPAAAGLQAAHDAGLVHRDIKPENLLIGRDGSVRVTDFGLARAAADATATIGPEVLVGSPHYLAPEAVQGAAVDGRADVYALGILLFECLTGSPPHSGETPFSTALAHVERAVPAPSSLGYELDPALDALVLASTARHPPERTHTAAAFAHTLRAAVGDTPGLLPRVTDVQSTSVPPRPPVDPAAPTPPLGTNGPPPAPGHTVVVPVAEVQTQLVDTNDTVGDHPTTPPEPGPPRPPANLASTEAEPRRQPDRRRRRWPWVVLLLTALIGGSALGGYLLWDRVLAPVTPIPSVLGAPGSNATEQLERAGFLPQILDRTVHDLGVPEGHVLTQEPQGDARTGTQVRLVLSAGPRQVMVPEVDGIPADDAVATLAAADLGAVVTEVHHERVPEGRVIGTDPPPGEEVDEGTEVAVTVSLGPTPIAVPELVGSDLAQARTLVRDAGLELTIAERRYDAAVPVDQVLAQDPAPGGIRYAGDVVEVVISDGPEPVVLPNVRGERVADAVATLEALGLEVEVERRGGFSAFFNPDRVYDQDPGPGSSRLPGETVLLYAYEP
ncbi:MAG: PASTA domain-containing protein [Nitriliruptor sp.]|nr:MAG: PASTA domain-containing protein [Nitriliruptor sp.]